MKSRPTTVDEYLQGVSDDKRAALEKLRRDIKAAVPDAEECISYSMPAFRARGRILVWFGGGARHCSFYPGAAPIVACHAALAKYDTSKGTVRFPPNRPLPTALVRQLVKARLTEQAGLAEKAAARPKARSGRRSR